MGVLEQSEIRVGYLAYPTYSRDPDWNPVVDMLASYKINLMIVSAWNIQAAYYPSAYLGNLAGYYKFGEILDIVHARGIDVFAKIDVPSAPSASQPELKAVDYTLTPTAWTCPTKNATRTLVKNMCEEFITKFPTVEGIMLDYTRYGASRNDNGVTIYSTGICYCPECKAKFEEWLGETITEWPGDFAPGGSRNKEFLEWRVIPMTELVGDMRKWMQVTKPDLKFAVAAWAGMLPTGRRMYLGQDTGDWVGKGYLDMVCPMLYVQPGDFPALAADCQTYFTAGPEGKIPLVFWVATGITGPIPLDNFKQNIEHCRTYGDGWIVWRYRDPGESLYIDIVPYLNKIRDETIDGLFDTFALENIMVDNITDTSARISWTTDLPATSKVEYSPSPLFPAYYKLWGATAFHYWDIDHEIGFIVEDLTPVANHSIILTGLMPGTTYFFRTQSEGSGIASSRVYIFKTTGVAEKVFLTVNSLPLLGVRVTLDGASAGVTPTTIEVTVGEHLISIPEMVEV